MKSVRHRSSIRRRRLGRGRARAQPSRHARQDQGGQGDQRRLFGRFAAVLVRRPEQPARRLLDRPLQARDRADRPRGRRAEPQGQLDRRHGLRAAADGRVRARPIIDCANTTQTLSRLADVDFSNLIFVDGGGFLVKCRFADQPRGRHGRQEDRRDRGHDHRAAPARDTLQQRLVERDGRARSTKPTKASRCSKSGSVDAFASDKIKLVGLAAQAKDPKQARVAGRGPVVRAVCASRCRAAIRRCGSKSTRR